MKHETQRFLSYRPSAKLVSVTHMPDTSTKLMCRVSYALDFIHSKRDVYKLVSGWLVSDYQYDQTSYVMPHYWVCDISSNSYFDTAPHPRNRVGNYDYLLDLDVFTQSIDPYYYPPFLSMEKDGPLCAHSTRTRVLLTSVDVAELYEILIRDIVKHY